MASHLYYNHRGLSSSSVSRDLLYQDYATLGHFELERAL
jgi:hypothetical protein